MRGRGKITAIIPAAGYSSRMGEFKPLVKLNGNTVIENAISVFLKAGINDVVVIAGYRSDEIAAIADGTGARSIINKEFKRGMFSSVVTGLQEISGYADGFFLLPGDMPLVKSGTVEKLLAESRDSTATVIYPSFMGERGHPPLVTNRCFDKILSADLSSSLRSILGCFENESADIEVIDQSILMDIDTPGDLDSVREYMSRGNIPTGDECTALFLKYKADENIIRHGKKVSEVACRITEILNASGRVSLNPELVKSAALLHDIARNRPHHALEGAVILSYEGFPRVAEVIAGHMDMDYDEKESVIDEAAVLYMADKLVQEDLLVSLHDRFADSSHTYSGNPEALRNIMKRRDMAFSIKKQIEKTAGLADLESVLKSREPEHEKLIS